MKAHSAAVIEAMWADTQSAMTRTPIPFLYQKRTLSSKRSLRNTTSQPFEFAPPSAQRFLHNSNIPISCVRTPSKPNKRLPKPSHTHNIDSNGSRSRNIDGIPWQPSSGVMNKNRGPFIAKNQGIPFEYDEDYDMNFSSEGDPFAEEDIFNDNSGEPEGSGKPTMLPARESTITMAERHAFERIFADIMARSKSTKSRLAPGSTPSPATPTWQSPGQGKIKESVNSIMDRALEDRSARKANSFTWPPKTKTQEELRADVHKYPIPLRAAAAKALGLVSGRSIELLEDEKTSNVDQLENIRQPERERVESLMRAAKTDIELWQVMEKEAFALVDKLGLKEKPKAQEENKKTRRKNRTLEESKNTTTPTQGGDQPLDLTIYGPLYPSHVLLGLRLLDRSFAKPSPLVLNVLPRIKSLGIVSQVLGASTALYNELLRIHWFRYDDFLGAIRLLSEMDQAGLEFDEETLSVVNEITQMQIRVRRGDKGRVLQALWSMPEFAPGKFKVWGDKIQASLDERKTDPSNEVAWT